MRVGIIGYGSFGRALCDGLKEDVHVSILDPKFPDTSFQKFIETKPHIIFICVPTIIGGAYDDSLIINYVSDLKDYSGQVIVRGAIPLLTTEKIVAIRSSTAFWL